MSPRCKAALASLLFAWSMSASAISVLAGRFDDPLNPALVDSQLDAPFFGDDYEVSQNVALYDLVLVDDAQVTFESTGFAAGGANPYFTLFAGAGPGATFVGSNYAIATDTGGDFSLSFSLLAGDYQVALGVYTNMSVAENQGSGTLGDGFIQIGDPSELGDASYSVNVVLAEPAGAPVPELPATWMLPLGLGALGLLCRRRSSTRA